MFVKACVSYDSRELRSTASITAKYVAQCPAKFATHNSPVGDANRAGNTLRVIGTASAIAPLAKIAPKEDFPRNSASYDSVQTYSQITPQF